MSTTECNGDATWETNPVTGQPYVLVPRGNRTQNLVRVPLNRVSRALKEDKEKAFVKPIWHNGNMYMPKGRQQKTKATSPKTGRYVPT